MAISEGKQRRGLTLPDEVWEAIDAAAGVEHKPVPDIIRAAILHRCPVPPEALALDQLALDVQALRDDLKALLGLLERSIVPPEASKATAVAPDASPKEALAEWYASNQIDWAAVEPAETPPAAPPAPGWVRRLWRWLVYAPKRTL